MANKKIDTKILLTDAMGVVKSMTPQQVVKQWQAWSAKYPKEKEKLNPGIVVAFDTLATVVSVYDTIQTVINTIQNTVVGVNKAYTIALSILPGIGAANGAKEAAETAMGIIKEKLGTVMGKLQKLPTTIFDKIQGIKVSRGAKI